MISRSDLAKWANENGYSVTEDQIERWHKKGIIPRPKRDNNGLAGSAYFYPEGAKKNLVLALQSNARGLHEKLLDVWFGGGEVSAAHLRPLLLKPLQAIHGIVKGIGKTLDKLATATKKAPFWTTDLNDFMATANLMLHVLSPREDDVLWGHQSLGERSAAEIAEEVVGVDQLRALVPSRMSETSEEFWNDVKKNLNIGELIRAVKTATDSDFDAILPYVRVMEPWIYDLSEVASLGDKRLRIFAVFRDLTLPRYMIRLWFIIVALVAHKNENTTDTIRETTEEWARELPRLKIWADYVRHMKKHPRLRRRKGWDEYFKTCGEEILTDIRRHHQEYVALHPELLALLEMGQTVG